MVHPTGHQSKVMVMKHNLKLAQRLGLSTYDLHTIEFIVGESETFGSISLDSDIVFKMLNYIDLMNIYPDDNSIYQKIADADSDAFEKVYRDKTFHYVGLLVDFDKNTVSVLCFVDSDMNYYYTTARKGR